MPFDYSDKEWPLLVIKASGQSTDEDMDEYLGTLSLALGRRERHVVIVDASEGQGLKGTHRQRVANWNKKNAGALAQYRAGLVLVTENALLRGLITAVYWLFTPPFPYKTADTVDEARRWAYQSLGLDDRPLSRK